MRVFSEFYDECRDTLVGEIFTKKNLRVIRPGYGVKPKYLKDLLGKRSSRAIGRGEPVSDEVLREVRGS